MDYSTEPHTIAMVTAARLERGLPALITELYEGARAHERGQQLQPSTPGMQMLLTWLKQRHQAETERIWRDSSADYAEMPAALGDDPQLLRDEIPAWLLNLPPVAHGIPPLPPLGGMETRE